MSQQQNNKQTQQTQQKHIQFVSPCRNTPLAQQYFFDSAPTDLIESIYDLLIDLEVVLVDHESLSAQVMNATGGLYGVVILGQRVERDYIDRVKEDMAEGKSVLYININSMQVKYMDDEMGC